MANRITDKHLDELCTRLNKLTGNPEQPWSVKPGADKHTANIGNYHISHAYGGVCLHQIMNEGGGVTCPLSQGHGPKRALYDELRAFIAGIELQQSNEVK